MRRRWSTDRGHEIFGRFQNIRPMKIMHMRNAEVVNKISCSPRVYRKKVNTALYHHFHIPPVPQYGPVYPLLAVNLGSRAPPDELLGV